MFVLMRDSYRYRISVRTGDRRLDIIPLAVLVFIAQDRLAVRQRFQNPLFQ